MKKVWTLVVALGLALAAASWAQPALLGAYALTTAIGLCVGSFLNVVVWRLPQMLQRESDAAAREHLGLPELGQRTFNLSFPHSHCPCCKARLRARDLVPVFSWASLRGQCRYCQTAISARYPLAELLVGGLSLGTVVLLGPTLTAGMLLVVGWLSVAAALIDADTFLLPDELTQPLLWVVLLASAADAGLVPLDTAVWGAAAGYGSAALMAKGGQLLFGRESLGQGDWKYLAGAGALLGPTSLPLIWLTASLLALCWAAAAVAGRSAKPALQQPMPFGPHLVVATMALALGRPWVAQLQLLLGINLL